MLNCVCTHMFGKFLMPWSVLLTAPKARVTEPAAYTIDRYRMVRNFPKAESKVGAELSRTSQYEA